MANPIDFFVHDVYLPKNPQEFNYHPNYLHTKAPHLYGNQQEDFVARSRQIMSVALEILRQLHSTNTPLKEAFDQFLQFLQESGVVEKVSVRIRLKKLP